MLIEQLNISVLILILEKITNLHNYKLETILKSLKYKNLSFWYYYDNSLIISGRATGYIYFLIRVIY